MARPKFPKSPMQKKRDNHPGMLLCHFTNGELEGLDDLQGGPSVDPYTGVREYSKLAEIIEIPVVREIFRHVQSEIDRHGKVSPKLEKIYKNVKKHSLPYRETPQEEDNPYIRRLEKMGRGGDTKVAWIPYNVAEFLIEMRHVPSVNPKTGLLEFGFWKEISRPFQAAVNVARRPEKTVKNIAKIAGATAGAIIGGPLGAGAGRALTGMALGEDFKKSLSAGLTHMGRAAVLSGVGGALHSVAPGATGAIGNFAGQYMTPGMMGAAGNFFTGPMSTMGMLGLGAGATAAGSAAGAAGAGAGAGAAGAGAAGAAGAKAASTGMLGKLLSNPALLVGGMGALSYLGSRKQHQQSKQAYEQDKESFNNAARNMGLEREFKPLPINQLERNPEYNRGRRGPLSKYGAYTAAPYLETPQAYYKGGHVKSYNKGTLVKGPGNGQDDKIRTSVPEGSYIIDASSTSMFGDGSSEAGARALKQFENKIKRGIPKHHYVEIEEKVISRSPQLPVFLSNDEYKFDPTTVSILGGGSNEKGSRILKEMVRNLRRHKNGNGDRLPPKAKRPEFYIKGR